MESKDCEVDPSFLVDIRRQFHYIGCGLSNSKPSQMRYRVYPSKCHRCRKSRLGRVGGEELTTIKRTYNNPLDICYDKSYN